MARLEALLSRLVIIRRYVTSSKTPQSMPHPTSAENLAVNLYGTIRIAFSLSEVESRHEGETNSSGRRQSSYLVPTPNFGPLFELPIRVPLPRAIKISLPPKHGIQATGPGSCARVCWQDCRLDGIESLLQLQRQSKMAPSSLLRFQTRGTVFPV